MKRFFLLIIVTFFISAFSVSGVAVTAMPSPTQTHTPIDGIAATVNGDIIMNSEVNQAMKMTTARLKSSNIPLPPQSNLRANVLQQLINQKLQLQLAIRNGIKVSPAQLKAYMKALAKSQNLSLKQLKDKFSKQGLHGAALNKLIKEQIMISAVQHQALASLIKPSAKDVASIKAKIINNQNNHTFYNINDILITLPDNPTNAQIQAAKQQANMIKQQLHKGTPLTAIKGATINTFGWKNINQLPTVFVSALKGKQKNDIIGPIKAGNGFHVLQLIGTRKKQIIQPTMQQIQQIAMQEKYAPAMMKWIKQLRKNSYIEIVPAP